MVGFFLGWCNGLLNGSAYVSAANGEATSRKAREALSHYGPPIHLCLKSSFQGVFVIVGYMISLSRKSQIIVIVITIVLLSVGSLVFWKYKQPKCQNVIGDGYDMGSDPAPVIIGKLCDQKDGTREFIR